MPKFLKDPLTNLSLYAIFMKDLCNDRKSNQPVFLNEKFDGGGTEGVLVNVSRRTQIMEAAGVDSVETIKALASETRGKMLALLADNDLNVNELAQALGLSQPTMTKHINILESVGIIKSSYVPGTQGIQKRCHLVFDRFIFTFDTTKAPSVYVVESEMPIGLYSMARPTLTCGLAGAEGFIGFQDQPQAFFMPERVEAQLLWAGGGYVEYVFANTLPSTAQIQKLEVSAELCSEIIDYNNEYLSDITVWINGFEIGTWTSPGDMGGKRGLLNPVWWSDFATQYGFLKTWMVDEKGSHVDETQVSRWTIHDLHLSPDQAVIVRIGIKPEAAHPGGFNLFGRGFGNFDQGLLLRLHYSLGHRRRTSDDPRQSERRRRSRVTAGEEYFSELAEVGG